ncbi:MAG: hypothetical protein R3B47_00750 [Bacteroidia bacterium]
METSILVDLEEARQANDQSLSQADFNKITFYYGLAVAAIAEVYCQLRGKTLSPSERRTLTYLGG